MKFSRVVAVGLGGIWSYLWIILGRMLSHRKEAPKEVLLFDGDEFVPENASRQDMVEKDVGRMKADVYATRMKVRFPELTVRPHAFFVAGELVAGVKDSVHVREAIPDESIVIVGVDNHAARYTISKHLQTLRNAVLISGGNNEWDGNVQWYVRSSGENLTRPIEAVHEEIAHGKDRNPGEMSCEERLSLKGETQWAVTNNLVAAFMAIFLDRTLTLSTRSTFASDIRKAPAEVMFDAGDMSALGYIRAA